MEVTQDNTAMLPPGDFEKLSKHEREEFHALQEKMVQYLIQGSNHFQVQFPGLHVEWRFQVEVYSSVQMKPSTVHYSGRVY
ncbi:MAG TPA: hypothetical protein VKR06_46305 [Ktedonosporobacter sp.]|nr:hypothetical protein [Ktedonosporobacter sp.]